MINGEDLIGDKSDEICELLSTIDVSVDSESLRNLRDLWVLTISNIKLTYQ